MKYVPSALIGQLSRSQGSTTASHNRFGSYFRNRVIPANPRTTQQSYVRAVFGSWSQWWRGLTQLQRDAWVTLGLTMSRTDTQGQTYTLTGLQAFMSCNTNLWTVVGGGAPPSSPAISDPGGLTPIALTDLSITAIDASAGTVAINGVLGDMTSQEQFQASAPVSAGKMQVPSSAYRDIRIVDNSSATLPIAAGGSYTAVFGSITGKAGLKVFWRYKSIDPSNGFATGWIYGSTIIVA